MSTFDPILTAHADREDMVTRAGYESVGGWETYKRAVRGLAPAAIVQTVIDSNLRGRGGAGFPTGKKWTFLPKNHPGPFYLLVNADESEPGTFKDRFLLERVPHRVLEGIALAAYATGCEHVYIYARGEFHCPQRIVQRAIDECYEAGYFGRHVLGSDFSIDVTWHAGAGAYMAGEETGAIESLEGKRAWPRIKPPFPAVNGLFNAPTVINNVETLACVAPIVQRGADWFKSIGPANSPGPKLFGLSGHVNRTGIFELPMGLSLAELIDEHGRGMLGGRKFKSCIPGGVSVGFMSPDEIETPLDFDSLRPIGLLGLGTACAIVMDETASVPRALYNIARFFSHESCGQCTHCREGTTWMAKTLERLLGDRGERRDIDLLRQLAESMGMMKGLSICGLSDAAAWPVKTAIDKFRDEFESLTSGTTEAQRHRGTRNSD